MTTENEYFQWPTTAADILKAWEQAETIYDADMVPDWLDNADEWGSIRYLCNSSWAYVSHAEQAQYFEEMQAHPDCIIAHADDGDGCVTHFYIMTPEGIENDHWPFMDTISTLADLLNSDEYDSSRFGSSFDDWIDDPERAKRCDEAAEHGADGSTHQETIQDWRKCLQNSFDDQLTEQTRALIEKEIDDCEQWHIDNGSIDTQLS